MPRIPLVINYEKIYQSGMHGEYKIIKEVAPVRYEEHTTVKRRVIIKFLLTGTEKEVDLACAIRGTVSDPYYPTVCGVACLGETNRNYTKKEYDIWYKMIERCYDRNSKAYRDYGALGVTVCDRWHIFSNFLEDLESLPGYCDYYNNPGDYQLDKDFLQRDVPTNKKIYSPQTCMFLKAQDNSRLAAESRRFNNDGFSTEYYGLYKTPYNTYQCTIIIDSVKYFLGTYKNAIAAANVYNFVAARCCTYPNLNDVPYMDINEALSYNSGRKAINFPPNIDTSMITNNNVRTSSQYVGVLSREYSYAAAYNYNKKAINIGTFKNEIAAANAHNWYESFYGNNKSFNDVPYMSPSEWLGYKIYANGVPTPVPMCSTVKKQMCHITN